MNDKLNAAKKYASWGWSVFPLMPNSKVPATRNGFHDSTTDIHQIESWWQRNPDYNIGVSTGKKSGIIVFDVDPRNGGDWSWDDWLEEMGDNCLKNSAMQMTAGGGNHYIAMYTPKIRSCKLFPSNDPRGGVDVLSDGRYFVIAPSIVAHDKTGELNDYCWELSSDPEDGVPPFTVPENWIDKIHELSFQRESSPGAQAEILTGGRNNALTAIAGSMRNFGLTRDEILAALEIANDARCKPPLPDSDVRRIADSVSRYEPNEDVATNASLGAIAIENILAGVQQHQSDYYFTRASSFLTQPAPIPWLVRGWLPASALCVIFGQSGIGKTFTAIDIACSVASGREWFGCDVSPGPVAYMAGEGNFGIRTRVASWCKHHNVDESGIRDLFVSNRQINLDAPGAEIEVLKAINEMTEDRLSMIVVDTLARHLQGDESHSKDINHFLNICSVLSAATGATVVLVHHTGHQGKDRERGSSAIRGAMNASIHIAAGKNGHLIIKCAKQKDAPQPEDLCAKLLPIDLGWFDDKGVPIDGMLAVQADLGSGKPDDKSDVMNDIDYKLAEFRQLFEDAWLNRGAELNGGVPYITRGALNDHLLTKTEWSLRTVKNHLTRSRKSGMIYKLIEGAIIEERENGWIMIDAGSVSSLLMIRDFVLKGQTKNA